MIKNESGQFRSADGHEGLPVRREARPQGEGPAVIPAGVVLALVFCHLPIQSRGPIREGLTQGPIDYSSGKGEILSWRFTC